MSAETSMEFLIVPASGEFICPPWCAIERASHEELADGFVMHRSAPMSGPGWSFDFGGSYAADGVTQDPLDPPQFYPARCSVEGYTVEMVAAMASVAAQVTP